MFKVLKPFKGSPDGFTVHEYPKDAVVDLPSELADVALAEKWVKRHKEATSEAPGEVELTVSPIDSEAPE